MTKSIIYSLFGIVVFFAQTVHAEDVSFDTYRGEVNVAKGAESVVALDVSAIDTLDALGVDIEGIPSPHYVNYLADVASNAKKVGSLFEPDFEALANMAPDVIVAGGRSSKQFDQLSRIAPTIDMTIWGENHLEQVLSRLHAYGKLFGKEVEAAEVARTFENKLDEARGEINGKGDALIVMTNGPKVSAFGSGSRFGWLHAALNLPEAVEGVDEQTHGEVISFEFIAEANPDWLIIVDRGSAIGQKGDGAAETLKNALVAETNAWKSGNVIYLNSANIYIANGGIQSMSATLDELIAAFSAGN